MKRYNAKNIKWSVNREDISDNIESIGNKVLDSEELTENFIRFVLEKAPEVVEMWLEENEDEDIKKLKSRAMGLPDEVEIPDRLNNNIEEGDTECLTSWLSDRFEWLIEDYDIISIDIEEITLLSIEEYKKLKREISRIDDFWWLRSPGYTDFDLAACVIGADGIVSENGYYVSNKLGVRPALKISYLKSSNLRIGDKIEVAGCMWTIISSKLALCDDFIGKQPFREDCKADDANDYEASDVKKYLKDWLHSSLSIDE